MSSTHHRYIVRPVLAGGMLLFLLAWNPVIAVELPFGAQTDLLTNANGVNGPTSLVAGDINSDGAPDLIMCSQYSGEIWKIYTYGTGSTAGTLLVSGLDSPYSVDLGDVDHDGDLDLMVGQYNDITDPTTPEIILYEQTTSGWNAFTSTILTGSGVRAIKLADINNDGNLDYIYLTEGTTSALTWREGTGNIGWSNYHSISSTLGAPWDLEVADLDRDGDLDLVVADVDLDSVYWYENDGSPDDGGWVEHTVVSSFDSAVAVGVGDINGDGSPDIVAAAALGDRISWFEMSGSNWTEHNVIVGLDDPETIRLADMDFDGDLDIVVGSRTNNEVLWVENSGGNGVLWLRRSIQTSFSGTKDVLPVDMDGDGDLDIAAVAGVGDRLSWWENQNTHRRFVESDPITVRDSLNDPRAVAVADINGDGLKDMVLGGWSDSWVKVFLQVNETSWWENSVETGNTLYRDIAVADMDQDGDLDILGVSMGADAVYWWANDGAALPSWTRHTILSSFNGAHTVEPVDLDSDGDLDVVVCAFDDDEATIVINDDGVGGSWTKKNFTPLDGAYSVAVGDLNNDGKPDFVASGYYEDVIRVYIQGETLWSSSDITGLDGPRGVALADIDQDGDLDIVGAIRNDNDITWFENDGTGGTWTAHDVGAGYLSDGSEVQAVDIDHDGDIDVVATGYLGDDVVVWRNDGDGSSWSRYFVESGLDSPWQAVVEDVNGDNNMDLVLVAAGTTDSLTWYKNIGAQFGAVAYDYAPSRIEDSEKDSIFNFIIMHGGRDGADNDLELTDLQLYFEDQGGTPLSSAQINSIVDRMEVYLDTNDDLIWTEGVDDLLATDLYLSLSGGTLDFGLAHGLAGNVVAPTAVEGFFIVIQAASNASQQGLGNIIVTMKTDQLQCQDRSAEMPLIGEPAEDVTTGVISFGSSIFSDGFESGNTTAWDGVSP